MSDLIRVGRPEVVRIQHATYGMPVALPRMVEVSVRERCCQLRAETDPRRSLQHGTLRRRL